MNKYFEIHPQKEFPSFRAAISGFENSLISFDVYSVFSSRCKKQYDSYKKVTQRL
ncbi:hypothetical protein [Angelakisella massiliensis]|uniref:hypothetical protein n=1 Tax=Angelakisella massiliensis TaxID=1871018 RepID=UPI00155F078F|nr:hypothetical protein [Angelakisella massiliensis]